MDYMSNLVLQVSQATEQDYSYGIVTPLLTPSSPLSPDGDAPEEELIQRAIQADKERRLNRYFLFNDIVPVSVVSIDADEFYNQSNTDVTAEGGDSIEYLYLPHSGTDATKEGCELKESVLRAYDRYDVHRRQELMEVTPDSKQSKYDDALELNTIGDFNIDYSDSLQYKNNLVECHGDFMFIALNTFILIFKSQKLYNTVDTVPSSTSRRDRSGATWSFFPHTINFLKISEFNLETVISCAIDDGRVLIYPLYELLQKGARHEPKYELKVEASAWGVDSYQNMFAVSDNTQRLYLFYLEKGHFSYCTSVQVIHNMPDVSFIHTENPSDDSVYVSCVSISGEFIIFKIARNQNPNYQEELSPFDSIDYPITFNTFDSSSYIQKYDFECTVYSRTVLAEDAWSVNYIDSKWFKEVFTPEYLGASDTIDTMHVLTSSRMLNLLNDHLLTSDLGGASWYQLLSIATTYDKSLSNSQRDMRKLTDRCNRIRKAYFEKDITTTTPFHKDMFSDKFLVTTTASRVRLSRVHRLLCNAMTGDLFNFSLHADLTHSNRLSIVRLIPELSAVITVSQAGFLTVFRLVTYRGLHSMREEHVITRKDFNSKETVIGVGVRKVSDLVFWLYVASTNGTVTIYELKEVTELGALADSLVN